MDDSPETTSSDEQLPGCRACGSPTARPHDGPGGMVLLCPACAVLAGLGCP